LSSYAQMAHDKRNQAIADLRAILDRAADEKRDISPEEQEQIERAEADVQKYAAEADRANRADQFAKEAAEFRGIETRIETATVETVKQLTDADHFVRGFEAVRSGGFYGYTPDDREYVAKFRALQTQGGSAIDESFSTQLTVYLREESPMFGAPITVLPTPRGEPFTWPRLTADPNHGGTITAEAGGINELDPTLSSVTFGAFKYGITNLWSAEVDNDNVIGLQGVIARSTARELAIDAGAHLTTGTGTVQPTGIVVGATAGYTATGTASGQATDLFFSPTDLLQLFGSVVSGYRNRSSSGWMVSNTAATKMRIFKDSTGNFMWEPSLISGQPDRFYGRPVIENPAMAAVASASKSVLFGDLSAYYTRIVGGPRVEFSRDYKFNTDQLALRTIIRVDGNLIDAAAIKSLVSANT
jgi:HK97 family phage major capsid protein